MEFLDVLTELGRSGGIGPVRPLAGLADVVAAHGWAARSGSLDGEARWPRWFMYGDLSLEACRCRVINRVSLRTWYETVSVPVAGAEEPLTFVPAADFRAVREAFARAGVAWYVLHRTDGQFTIATVVADLPEVTVAFTFTDDEFTPYDELDGRDAALHSVHATEHSHLC